MFRKFGLIVAMAKRTDKRPRVLARAGPDKATASDPAPDPWQHPLFTDPLPERIEPCLAKLVPVPPTGPNWAFELKWDGYRLHIHVDNTGQVRILTRGGHDWTHRFPDIERAALELDVTSIVLDGEAVVLDGKGASNFGMLQQDLGGRGGKRVATDALFYAFDVLYLNGLDLRPEPLADRRLHLESVVEPEADGRIRLSQEVDADGPELLRHACAHGLEGIIAKNRNAPYRSGRGGEWLKIKCVQSESFAIVGYEPSEAFAGAIGSLLLAARQSDGFVFVGGVGSGFKRVEAIALRKQLDDLRTDKPAVKVRGKSFVWVEPDLIAEIEFRGWTGEGQLRHASFKGLRDEADEASVYRITP